MPGLLKKIAREVWAPTLLFASAMMSVMALLTYVLPQVQHGLDDVVEQIPMVKHIIAALLGSELGDQLSARTMQAFLWVHPVVLALMWAHEIWLCSRTPAGEIDRGTVDVLFSLPVSRRAVYLCETAVWLATGVVLLAAGLLGHRAVSMLQPDQPAPTLARSLLVIVNLYCVYLAVGGIAFLVSACSDRRGRAIAVVFGIVLASFLLNFLAQFWEPARQIAFLSVMEYYRPALVLQHGGFPVRDAALLLAIAVATWLAGGEVFARRSLCAI